MGSSVFEVTIDDDGGVTVRHKPGGMKAALAQCILSALRFTPTPECINHLPEPLRRYVHDLETREPKKERNVSTSRPGIEHEFLLIINRTQYAFDFQLSGAWDAPEKLPPGGQYVEFGNTASQLVAVTLHFQDGEIVTMSALGNVMDRGVDSRQRAEFLESEPREVREKYEGRKEGGQEA